MVTRKYFIICLKKKRKGEKSVACIIHHVGFFIERRPQIAASFYWRRVGILYILQHVKGKEIVTERNGEEGYGNTQQEGDREGLLGGERERDMKDVTVS